jgi:hypothetical protein
MRAARWSVVSGASENLEHQLGIGELPFTVSITTHKINTRGRMIGKSAFVHNIVQWARGRPKPSLRSEIAVINIRGLFQLTADARLAAPLVCADKCGGTGILPELKRMDRNTVTADIVSFIHPAARPDVLDVRQTHVLFGQTPRVLQ